MGEVEEQDRVAGHTERLFLRSALRLLRRSETRHLSELETTSTALSDFYHRLDLLGNRLPTDP